MIKTKQTISYNKKTLKKKPNKTIKQKIQINFLIFIINTKILSINTFYHIILYSKN